MSEFIAPIAIAALLVVVAGGLYDRTRQRLATTSAYWRTRPTALEITGMCVLVLVVMGLAMNALPQRWPEWLRGSIGLGTIAAISWGGWMIRNFRADAHREPGSARSRAISDLDKKISTKSGVFVILRLTTSKIRYSNSL